MNCRRADCGRGLAGRPVDNERVTPRTGYALTNHTHTLLLQWEIQEAAVLAQLGAGRPRAQHQSPVVID